MPGVPAVASSPAAWRRLTGAAPLLVMLILAGSRDRSGKAGVAAANDGEGLEGVFLETNLEWQPESTVIPANGWKFMSGSHSRVSLGGRPRLHP